MEQWPLESNDWNEEELYEEAHDIADNTMVKAMYNYT